MQTVVKTISSWALAVAALASGQGAQAATTPILLSEQNTAQLSSWLGEGPLSLTPIYTKAAGDTSLDFHAAADGKGRTFSVMEASNKAGQTWLVGGYNPQSWSASAGLHVTMPDSERTAFLFNLTSGLMLPQLKQYFSGDGIGSGQTYNDRDFGPTFGIGHDLYVPRDLTNGGYSYLYTYSPAGQPASGLSLVDGSANASALTFGALQVYSISAVPQPATAGMLLAGLALLGGLYARKRAMPADPSLPGMCSAI
ncbi:PEP_CTERM-anchored TLD domain-containing protein [Janthinobacterium sp. PC23-8]|uniref:PEP_CTERM-anchored TLD domain-containing protein n=1 Tax=Janthinobacterium sp. PC23-8 TaxID=2012679 RepID=UPI000B9746F0|nr:PEP_CTERM-anchored TLD domain-containing protein [Janthinobacterium sp. PC23-8]OYO26352.1 VPLPA-CTERM sorting domain-containing protein [Janthinobacterium sp. PC23-8]